MELYTLTPNFFLRQEVEKFTSLIWIERYASSGDFQLVLEPSWKWLNALQEGTFLWVRGSRTVMVVDTLVIKGGLMTVTGFDLVKFLDQRLAWFANLDRTSATEDLYADRVETTTAGQLLSDVVHDMVINPTPFTGDFAAVNLDWDNEKIPNLSLGHVDASGDTKELTFPLGPLYTGLEQIGNNEAIGFKLYLDSANYETGEYSLIFATYHGRDLTSNQTVNELVRFSAKTNTLFNSQEVVSNATYKDLAYVVFQNQISRFYTTGNVPTGFNRRVVQITADRSTYPHADAARLRRLVAHNALAKAIKTRSVDGEVSSQSGYIYGVDYHLGDVVELEGQTGVIGTARVTEFIRSQDQYGEKHYPGFTPLDSYVTSNYTPEWTGSPNWTPGEVPIPVDTIPPLFFPPPNIPVDMIPLPVDTGGGGTPPPDPGLNTSVPPLTALSLYLATQGFGNPPQVAPSGETILTDWRMKDLTTHVITTLDDFATSPDPNYVGASGSIPPIIGGDGSVYLGDPSGDLSKYGRTEIVHGGLSQNPPWRAWVKVNAIAHNTFNMIIFSFNNPVSSGSPALLYGGLLFVDPTRDREGIWSSNESDATGHTVRLATDPRTRPFPNDNFDAEMISVTPLPGETWGYNGPAALFYQVENNYMVVSADEVPAPPFWVVLTVNSSSLFPEIWTTDPALA